jgi:hypothetical protein
MFPEFLYLSHLSLSDRESTNEDVGQANKNMDCDPTFAGACSSNEPHLLIQGDLNHIFRDLNLSKKQAELSGSKLKGSSRTLSCVCTVGTMKNSRICSPGKMVSYFAIMIVPFWKFLAMNITQISEACSLIRQK